MFRTFILIVFISVFVWNQCAQNVIAPDEKPARALSIMEKSVVTAGNQFGFQLFQEVMKNETEANVFISPLSVSIALGMTLNGANGNTYDAMQKTLQFTGLTSTEINESYKSLIELLTGLDYGVQFDIANSIWYRQDFTIETDFINLNKTYFGAQVQGLDFNSPGAPQTINNWVNNSTKGKISQIVDGPIHPMTLMFLINAIYFKGVWTYKFDKNATTDEQFYLADGSTVPCKMMKQSADFLYMDNDLFQAVDLPYHREKFRMLILLPKPGKTTQQVIEQLNYENWKQWVKNLAKLKGDVQLPRFKMEYKITLNDALESLGMGIAFSSNADFTKMYKPGNLFINEVKHKTFVEVNEEGTEAAAVTSVEMRFTSVGPSDSFFMRIDRPFIFAIHENHSETILFIGKIGAPGN